MFHFIFHFYYFFKILLLWSPESRVQSPVQGPVQVLECACTKSMLVVSEDYPVNHLEENQIFAPDKHFTRNLHLFCLQTKCWMEINFSIFQSLSTLLPKLFVAE